MDIVTRTASVEAWPKAVAPPHIRRAHASPGANRKRFMIRTSLRISLRRRNRTFAKALAGAFAKKLRRFGGNEPKIFIDRLLRRWLKVGSSGVKWATAPRDQWTPIPNPNASMPESSDIPLTRKTGSPSHRAGDVIVLRISFFCLRRHTSFCWLCRRRSLRK